MSDSKHIPPHYTIGTFADMVGLPQSKVRFYERSGLLPVRKLDNGYRYFLPEDAIRLLEEEQSDAPFTQSLARQREELLAEQERLKSRIDNIDRTLNLIHAAGIFSETASRPLSDIEQGERFSIVDELDVLYVRASNGRDFSVSTRNAEALCEFVHMLPTARYMRIIRLECFENDSATVDPDYIVGIPATDLRRLKSSPYDQLEILKLGRCLRYIRLESRKTSVQKKTFDPVFTYLREHGYRMRGDMLLMPTFLNLNGKGLDIELLYVPIA